MRLTSLLALLFALATAPLCAEPLDDGNDHSAELTVLMQEAVAGTRQSRAELRKQLVLPNASAWFVRVFGEAAGARGALRYEKLAKDFEGLEDAIESAKGFGASKVTVTHFTNSQPELVKDEAGVSAIFAAMKEKVSLYIVRLNDPDEDLQGHTIHLGAFVFSTGAFRFVGVFEGAVIFDDACLGQLKHACLLVAHFESKDHLYPGTLSQLIDPDIPDEMQTAYRCPCHPDSRESYHYMIPVEGDEANPNAILFWCPHLHNGKRQYSTFGGTASSVSVEDFDILVKDQYAAGLKALPAARNRTNEFGTQKGKRAMADAFLKELDAFEIEARAALEKK